jgi:hypothetical protein
VDYEKCDEMIMFIRQVRVPPDEEEPIPLELAAELMPNFNLLTAAISHQTTPLKGMALEGWIFGRKRFGWDYHRESWLLAVHNDPTLLTPKHLLSITIEALRSIYEDGQDMGSISRPGIRVELLRDVGQFLLRKNWCSIQSLYDEADGHLIRNDRRGILQGLRDMRAFQDPLQKKSFFFLELMWNKGLWKPKDPEHLGPPVDYHECRGHLRYGTVRIMNPALREKLLRQVNVTDAEDRMIRQAVYNAITYIAQKTGYDPLTLHGFFWNIFRNCCKRENPHCITCSQCTLLDRYRLLPEKRCLFAESCNSARKPAELLLIEPHCETTWY